MRAISLRIASVLGSVLILTMVVLAQKDDKDKVVAPPLISQPGKSGGQITLASTTPISSLNPFVNPEADEFNPLFLATLLEHNPVTGQLEPGLAKEFKVSEDSKQLILTLRDTKFSDGAPFTADDVLFTLNDVLLNERVKTEILEFLRATFLKIQGQFFIQSVVKLDERTVRFSFSVPMPSLFLDSLAQLPILPKHKLAGKDFIRAWVVGAKPEEFAGLGPFKVTELKRDNIKFARNEFYWKMDPKGTRLPYVDRVSWQLVKSEELLKLFQEGKIDILIPTDPTALPTSAKLIVDGPMERVNYLALNQDVPDPEKRAIFRDVRLRKALAHAGDRAAIAKQVAGGFGVTRDGFIHPLSPYADEAVKYEFDLKRAAALLDELGLKDKNGDGVRELPSGKELKLEFLLVDTPVSVAQGRLYQENLGRIGIKVELKAVSSGEFQRRTLDARPPQYEAALASTFINMRVPFMISDLTKLFKSDGWLHFYRFSDAKAKKEELSEAQRRIDEILTQLPSSTSAKALFSELQKILSEDLPLIPLYSRQFLVLLQPAIKNGEQLNAFGIPYFIEVLWRE